jgi:hypothetical protein
VADQLAAELAAYDEVKEQFEVDKGGGEVDPVQDTMAIAAALAPKAAALLDFAKQPHLPQTAHGFVAYWHGRSDFWWRRLASSLAELHDTLRDLGNQYAPRPSPGRRPGRPPEPFRPFARSFSDILASRCPRRMAFAAALLFAARDLVDDDLRQDHADGRCIRFDLLLDRVLAARKRRTRSTPRDGHPRRPARREQTPRQRK